MSIAVPEFEVFRIVDADGWKKVASVKTYPGKHIQIEQAEYLTPSRRDTPVAWTVAQRKAAVCVAPVLEDGRFVLISQERLPVQRLLWEFPAGQIDETGHPQADDATARRHIIDTTFRELREECGCALDPERGRLEPLGYFFPSQGFTTEHVYMFRAEPVCVVSRPEPDGSEHIGDVRFVSPGELRRMIAENEITNALTLALYARMSAKGWV